MPCFSPLHGYKSAQTNSSGKRSVVFQKKGAFVDLPVTVPCGQCIGCRIDRSQQWATRITHEAQFHTQKVFLTLTYSEENLPEGGTLVLQHLQLFLKRLRKQSGKKIRYFACGEYGDSTDRPHYHIILFGLDFPDKRQHSKNERGDPLFVSETLDTIWGKGNCWIGAVSWSSAAYVARYVIKKVNGEKAVEHYKSVNIHTGEIFSRKPEFIVMSRRPGIGSEFFAKFQTDLYPSDLAIVGGKPKKVPKFYDKQLEKQSPAVHLRLKSRRTAKAKGQADNNTPERLQIREEVTRSKISTLKRKL